MPKTSQIKFLVYITVFWKIIESERIMNKRRKKGCNFGCFGFLIFLVCLVYFVYSVGAPYLEKLSFKIKQIGYPIKYQEIVEEYSEKYSLDKYLVYSIIRTESKFDCYATSSVGAKGLMQIAPETGKDCAEKLGIRGYNESSLFEPEINIQIGCYYLSYLIKHYKSKETAIAAYNGGMGNVNSWLKDSRYSDGKGKLKNIPFKETRNYVTRVLDAEQKYKSIYSQ